MTYDCFSVNGWELSVMLENVLILWIGNSSYKNRLRLCGREPANGFELRRRLIADNHGGGVAVKMAGVQFLNPFPQCTSATSLCPRLDAWEDLFAEFGA